MRLALAAALLLALAGCQAKTERQAQAPSPAPAETTAAVTPAAPDTSAPSDPADAVRKYYAFLEARDYASAYAMWGDHGMASKQTFAQFADGFAHSAHTSVTVTAPVDIEGAAGSSYAEVKVDVKAETTAGAEQRFTGSYVVRRTNDVPGATPAQLRWHFNSARLVPVP